MPPEFRGYLDGAAGTAVRLVLGFLFMLFASPAFATLGGLLGVALIRKPAPAPRWGAPAGGGPTLASSPSAPASSSARPSASADDEGTGGGSPSSE
jgi:hypothetical protein